MEFKVPYLVGELLKVMDVPEKKDEGATSSNLVEYLSQNKASSSKQLSQSSLNKLAENSPSPASLIEKYEDLKSRNIREADPLMNLLCEISTDKDVKSDLKKHFNDRQIKKEVSFSGSMDVGTEKMTQHLHDLFVCKAESEVFADKKAEVIRTVPQGLVDFPKWLKERPNMTWDFSCQRSTDDKKVGPIGVLSHNAQEHLLMTDILFCLSGIDGDYVTALPNQDPCSKREFKYDESADLSLLEMTKRIMPLCSNYSTVVSFVEEKMHFKYGKVNHAVTASMREMLKDYLIVISQLENMLLSEELSLQKMWYFLQPTMIKMQALASVAIALNKGDCFGGAILSVLHRRVKSLIGDKVGQEICLHLVQSASAPYFEILQRWIYQGVIRDPFSEFLVEDNEICKIEDVPVEYSNNYWEKRYTLREENIPVFLEKVSDMILRTGKYLNVIRQCGHNITYPNSMPLTYAMEEQSYFERIKDAYSFASKKLLDLLMGENDLRGRLRSVKHYFLLDEGDFIVQFMDMAEEELHKDINNIMPTRLEALLELALRTSAVNCDKYKDYVKVALITESLQSQMSTILNILNISATNASEEEKQQNGEESILGVEAFTFDYEVKWPLSLIINQRAIACYQFLFRHLFQCKYVESLLGRVWTVNKITKTYPLYVSSSYAPAFALCQRMMNFIQNLDYYFSLEVIEPHWQWFMAKINQVTNVDEVLQCHEDFLNTCILDCMLAYPVLLEILGKLISLCVKFSNFMLNTHRSAIAAELPGMGESLLESLCGKQCVKPYDNAGSLSAQMTFEKRIVEYHEQFDNLFFNFLETITSLSNSVINTHQSLKMLNMLHRLDFSEYYTKKLEERSPPAEDEPPLVEL